MFVSIIGENIEKFLFTIPGFLLVIIVIVVLSLLFGKKVLHWIRYPKRFHKYLRFNIKRSMRKALLEVTDRNFKMNRERVTPEQDFMDEVQKELKKLKNEEGDLSIYALCGHKPWSEEFTDSYFNDMYEIAQLKVENRRKKRLKEPHKPAIVTRIFIEPEKGFFNNMEIWKHVSKHYLLKKEGVSVKIIPEEKLKSRHKLSKIGEDLLDGFGFIIIQPPTIIDREGRTTIKRFAYLHYGKDEGFKYVKWTDAHLVEEVWRMYKDISSNSEELDLRKPKYPQIIEEDVKGTNKIDKFYNVESSPKYSRVESSITDIMAVWR